MELCVCCCSQPGLQDSHCHHVGCGEIDKAEVRKPGPTTAFHHAMIDGERNFQTRLEITDYQKSRSLG